MILVYINTLNGIGKASYEAVTYAKKLNEAVHVLTNGSIDDQTLSSLGEYGAQKVSVHRGINAVDSTQICNLISSGALSIISLSTSAAILSVTSRSFFSFDVQTHLNGPKP